MRPTEQQLIELKLNLEIVTRILADRSDEVASAMFDLYDSDEAYSAVHLPQEVRAQRFDEFAERLHISGAQLRLLSAIFRSIS